MDKKDITITSDINSPNSRSERKVEREKALAVLNKAKMIPRTVVFLKSGDCQFSRKLLR